MIGRGRRRHRGSGNFRSESIGIAFKHLSYGLFADLFILNVVTATITIAISAVFSAGKTFTIELEAP